MSGVGCSIYGTACRNPVMHKICLKCGFDYTVLCLQTKSPALQAPQQYKPVPTPPTETELPAENPTDDTRLDALPTLFSLVKKRHAQFPSAAATTQFVSP